LIKIRYMHVWKYHNETLCASPYTNKKGGDLFLSTVNVRTSQWFQRLGVKCLRTLVACFYRHLKFIAYIHHVFKVVVSNALIKKYAYF
jgi:hypothetical protein